MGNTRRVECDYDFGKEVSQRMSLARYICCLKATTKAPGPPWTPMAAPSWAI